MKLLQNKFLWMMAVLLSAIASLPAQNATNTLPTADAKFVKEALEGGNMEVLLGQLASDNGSNQSVRAFGQQMVQDHKKAGDQLTQILNQKGVSAPPLDDTKTRKMISHLQNLHGQEFDQMYMKHMVNDHNNDIAAFQKEAKSGNDPDIKNWAQQTLPTLQQHLQLAKNAMATVSSSQP